MKIFVPASAALLTDRRAHGEGLIAWQLLSGLADRGHEIVACARHLDIGVEPRFEIVELGRRSRFESLEPIALFRAVDREFRRRGGASAFDLAHWIFPPNMDEIAFSQAAAVPFVYGPHSPPWPASVGRGPRPGDLIRAGIRPLLLRRSRHAMRSARLLLHATPEGLDHIPVDPGSRARLLPFGVDANRFTPSSLPAEPTVVFLGRLEREKNVELLLDAFARLREKSARLIIAGDGAERESLERHAAALRLDGRIEWLGAVEHEQTPALLRRASIVCSTAVGEPYGMGILEAMACGRAVVAIDAGGPRFLVAGDSGGRLVWPPTADAYARVLDDLLSVPARLAQIGKHNRERVEQELSLHCILDRLEELYVEAIE